MTEPALVGESAYLVEAAFDINPVSIRGVILERTISIHFVLARTLSKSFCSSYKIFSNKYSAVSLGVEQ